MDLSIAAILAQDGITNGAVYALLAMALVRGGRETPVLQALRALHAGGGLIAGSSAGAAMMSERMLLGGTSLESVVHGLTENPDRPGLLLGPGLGFFRFGMLDQHFIKRGRLGRLIVAMAKTGVQKGFGIDENTALFVDGRRGRVVRACRGRSRSSRRSWGCRARGCRSRRA